MRYSPGWVGWTAVPRLLRDKKRAPAVVKRGSVRSTGSPPGYRCAYVLRRPLALLTNLEPSRFAVGLKRGRRLCRGSMTRMARRGTAVSRACWDGMDRGRASNNRSEARCWTAPGARDRFLPGRPSTTWRFDMKIRDVMTRTAELTTPDDTLRHAAQRMKECDCGVLPVAESERLVGMITDRDIAVRGLAEGKGPDAKVREAMTQEIMYCFD